MSIQFSTQYYGFYCKNKITTDWDFIKGLGNYDDIEYIDSCKNQSKKFPDILPANLKFLNCCYNQLGEVPDLPNNLNQLYCANNPLRSLPDLNINLINFDSYSLYK